MVGPALKSQSGPGDTDVSLSLAAGCSGGPPHNTSPADLETGVVRSMGGKGFQTVSFFT